jgi:trimethylamine--corrinoid protein Co-methyltransferase
MLKTLEGIRPTIRPLSDETAGRVIDEALDILEKVGVFVENDEAARLLSEAGARTDREKKKTFIPRDLVMRCIKTAPSSITLYDSEGNPAMNLSGDNVHFDPGSAAINVLDGETGEIRKGMTPDFVKLASLVENLPNLPAQSTSFICYDVPEEIGDRYRLYLALNHCKKPVVTGMFQTDAFAVMKDMLLAVRGSEKALAEKPLAIFDACPSPPLMWSNLTTQSIIDCARYGIPSEMVSMPLSGATAPVTLLGSVTQHCAECMAGVVICQLAKEGAPIIWGGSPSIFDMKKGTTPMGAIETMMVDSAYAQVGKRLGLPTHAYMGLSDSKAVDAQAGLETGMGAMMAALSGINVISGAGMMDFESMFSLEKLVIDHDIVGMALRLVQGITPREEPFAIDLYPQFEAKGHFLSLPHTLKWFRKEFYVPSDVIDRSTHGEWQDRGSLTALDRARERVKKLLETGAKYSPPAGTAKNLEEIMTANAKKFGMDRLPRR